MRHASAIELDDVQREKLVRLAQSNTAEVRLARRAGIVLLAAGGFDNHDIGEMLDVGRVQVGRWRARYAAGGFKAIEQDLPRAGRKPRSDPALVTPEEVSAERMLQASPALPRVLKGADVHAALARGAPTERSPVKPARYAQGQKVQVRKLQADHHTRLPAYVLGKEGVVEQIRGVHVFADAHAQELGEQPQWLYAVAFDGGELWGDAGSPGVQVCIDAFEPYLEAL